MWTTTLILVVVTSFTMHISKDQPYKSRSILRVLAAYKNIGIRYSETHDQFVYDENKTFIEIFGSFLYNYERQSNLQFFEKHHQNVLAFHKKLEDLRGRLIMREEQNRLASQFLAELDVFYQQLYGIDADHPDKYVSLLNNVDIDFNQVKDWQSRGSEKLQSKVMRRVTKMLPLENLPKTYLHFYERQKHVTSQYTQDGVIEAIFDLIGTRNKFCVQVGGGNAFDNSRYLLEKKNWTGILFNSGNYLHQYLSNNTDLLKMEMISPQKSIQIFKKHNVPQELDFFSIDIDGNDYWVIKSLLQYYRPAVISVQINPNIPVTVAASIPNCMQDFVWGPGLLKYYGVSAKAMYDLGLKHGYSYVYHMLYTDIFLVRNDLLPQSYRGMDIKDTFDAFPIHFITRQPMKFDADVEYQTQKNCLANITKLHQAQSDHNQKSSKKDSITNQSTKRVDEESAEKDIGSNKLKIGVYSKTNRTQSSSSISRTQFYSVLILTIIGLIMIVICSERIKKFCILSEHGQDCQRETIRESQLQN